MKIAVLSGKGGTGKTFVSVNLAAAMKTCTYVDCDVEEPNGALFLKPDITERKKVDVTIPEFIKDNCVGCKKCVDFCAFNALAYIKDKPLLFNEVCHSCGGCKLVCENDAVIDSKREIGEILKGKSGNIDVLSGIMNLGEASGVEIINNLLDMVPDKGDTVIDCPPGSGCLVMQSIKSADYCILVAEPTEFGKHNLEMVYEMVNIFKKPFGVVLNKCSDEVNPSKDFCVNNNIEIIEKIPFDKDIAKHNSLGEVIYGINNYASKVFDNIYNMLEKKVMA